LDDQDVYAEIQRADTVGDFQIESRAQMQSLLRTKPETIDDLTIRVALVRPGPIQGKAVHPYIEHRRLLREDPSFVFPVPDESLREPLAATLGVVVFQDQVLDVAIALAGYTIGEAEGLRRAMSRKRSHEALEAHRERFVSGAIGRGVGAVVAEGVFDTLVGFSGFGFPKAHAAAFGLLAYQSAWLRHHYPAEFLCGLLNEQPMGFYPPDSLVHEAQRRGIRIAPPDANRSHLLCRVESAHRDGPELRGGEVVRIGLGYVKGVRKEEMEELVAERGRGGPYGGVAELASRSGAGLPSLEKLAWAGALDGIPAGSGSERREALWRVGVASAGRGAGGATQLALPLEPPEPPRLAPLGEWGKLIADYRSTGLTLGKHPMKLLRPGLDPAIASSADLGRIDDGATVEVAGMVVARQRPETAKGIVFMLLEDERGTVNLIVPGKVYDRHRALVRTAPLLRARGRLERREGTINVLVAEVAALERTEPPPAPAQTERAEPDPGARRERRRLAVAELRAVAPAGHSFGRRGR
ncbi:MAG TPA: OB-fold nucleic acid binding domain-containing protein, partial [Solirubrobacterales bacterium]